MNKLIIFMLFTTSLFASTHYARLMPIESIDVQSAISGKVVTVYSKYEGQVVENTVVVQIDDSVDRVQLQALQTTLQQVQKQLQINQEIATNFQESLQRQESHYRRVESLQTRPQSEKDSAFYNFINAQNQLLSTQEKIASLIEKEASTKHSIASLKDVIAKKRFVANGFVSSIDVSVGNYLNLGVLVMRVDDISKGKLIIYLSSDELELSEVYIEGQKHTAGFDKVWKTTDELHLSSYKAEIIINDLSEFEFGQLLKIEVK